MTELQLYRWLKSTSTEWHWRDNGEHQDVIMFISFYDLREFNDLIGHTITDEEGLECTLKDGYICIWMQEICDYHDVNMGNVFVRKEEK
ncbi:MAG: hypothetical protein WC238_06170 [Parcubacteria group bacterium]|jgi:hypothetical protein